MHERVPKLPDTVGLGTDRVRYPTMQGGAIDQSLRGSGEASIWSDRVKVVVEDTCEFAEQPHHVGGFQIPRGALHMEQPHARGFGHSTQPMPLSFEVGDGCLCRGMIFADRRQLLNLPTAQTASTNPSASS